MPPMMPFIHDALWLGFFAGLALFAWKMTERFDLRLSARGLHWPFVRSAAVPATSAWFTTTTVRSSGNSAFDEWRDGEIARIETERQTLEARLQAFEAFVDNLKRAKDRETFDRFTAQFRQSPSGGADGADPAERSG